MTNRANAPGQWDDVQLGGRRLFHVSEGADTCPDDCHYCSGPETD